MLSQKYQLGSIANPASEAGGIFNLALSVAVWGFAGYGVYMFATKKKGRATRRRRR